MALFFLSGLCGAALLALGSQLILTLDAALSGFCILIGAASAVAGLPEGR